MSDRIQGLKVKKTFSQDHIIMAFLLLVAFASGADLIADLSEGVDTSHIIQESLIMLASGCAFLWLAWQFRQSKQIIASLEQELQSVKGFEQSEEVIAVKKQLSDVIANQFISWKLSKSEQEVGLLLLKGFSLKEIAVLRGTAEKTIRQQASAIYKKAGLSGRHAFSAWFIEDFL